MTLHILHTERNGGEIFFSLLLFFVSPFCMSSEGSKVRGEMKKLLAQNFQNKSEIRNGNVGSGSTSSVGCMLSPSGGGLVVSEILGGQKALSSLRSNHIRHETKGTHVPTHLQNREKNCQLWVIPRALLVAWTWPWARTTSWTHLTATERDSTEEKTRKTSFGHPSSTSPRRLMFGQSYLVLDLQCRKQKQEQRNMNLFQ